MLNNLDELVAQTVRMVCQTANATVSAIDDTVVMSPNKSVAEGIIAFWYAR
jgi:hypothetical protein